MPFPYAAAGSTYFLDDLACDSRILTSRRIITEEISVRTQIFDFFFIRQEQKIPVRQQLKFMSVGIKTISRNDRIAHGHASAHQKIAVIGKKTDLSIREDPEIHSLHCKGAVRD